MSLEKASFEEEKNNLHLEKLFEQDQTDRKFLQESRDEKNMQLVAERDKQRLSQAIELYDEYKAGNWRLTSQDAYHLAMLFQHGDTEEDYARAFELATIAAENGHGPSLQLSALAEDRLLVSQGEAQKWGTQYRVDRDTGIWNLSAPIQLDDESGVTDQERIVRGLRTRNEAEAFQGPNN